VIPHSGSRPMQLMICAVLIGCVSFDVPGTAQTTSPVHDTGTPADEAPAAKAQRVCLETQSQFIRDHNQTEAWNGFVKATQIDPNYAPAWFDLAIMLENQKQWKQARDYFYRYLGVAPKGPDAIRAHQQTELLSKYISGEISPEAMKRADYDAAVQRARALLAAGFYREAIDDAGLAQKLDESRWESYGVVSLAMLRQHKLDEAAKMRDQAVAHAPEDKRDAIRAALSSEGAIESRK
jgi:tetratricopeptide (TPR) repeat protein